MLRQRRTVIGRETLVAHQGQVPGEARGAQAGGGAEPGEASSDDDDGRGAAHALTVVGVGARSHKERPRAVWVRRCSTMASDAAPEEADA
ncbi:hypothetical protein GCM10011331_04790 [Flavimobilis marinus]|nr:hypothetical protein GCM10011331_04790 [Flavimobilis marinus]